MFLSHIQETSTKLKFSTMFFNGAKKQYGYSSHVAITKSLGNILLLGYRDDSTAFFFFFVEDLNIVPSTQRDLCL